MVENLTACYDLKIYITVTEGIRTFRKFPGVTKGGRAVKNFRSVRKGIMAVGILVVFHTA